MQELKEYRAFNISGFVAIFVLCVLFVFIAYFGYLSGTLRITASIIGLALLALSGWCFTVVRPNEAKVLTFAGEYIGSVRESGFKFTLPSMKRTILLSLANFSTGHTKVNDAQGNPVEIGAVVTWRVSDTAQASFHVDNHLDFVRTHSDTALRTIAARYPYDSLHEPSLRGSHDDVIAQLKSSLQEKLSIAGITVEETLITHLAYAPEISQAMLKRQQAVALLEARKYMIENALSIVDSVIDYFNEDSRNVKLSEDKKADIIANLLAVMISDKELSPVLSITQ